jgi:lipopolysaccharide biosynthesis regulator YciM
MFEQPKDFDPYRDLVELKNFATSADTHLGNLLKNEKEIVKAINELSETIKQMKQRITLMEKVLNEIARS